VKFIYKNIALVVSLIFVAHVAVSNNIDNHSYSNRKSIQLKHLVWDATINFERSKVEAKATWKFKNVGKVNSITLDIADLEIKNINIGNRNNISFIIGDSHPYLGESLTFNILPTDTQFTITYTTTNKSKALQWLTPQQTAGKRLPYVFTQCEAINARSVLPCMDAPDVRFTYDATIMAGKGFMALMSATNPTQRNKEGKYSFKMDIPIPSYLFAFAAGDVSYIKINNQCGVYSEPTIIQKAASELSDIPKMIAAAEQLAGKYRWGKYDVLVQPPSFPIGGMENPKLTFSTPTILAGDKSLVSLIAHELAHSWSGNTVTNANWNELWLNEGFTTYFERRIMEAITNKDYVDMLWELSYQDMMADIKDFGPTHKYTQLKIDLAGDDPDDAFSNIPYEKGAHFLWLIEKTVGRKNFDPVLVKYFNTNAFKPMTTEMCLAFFKKELLNKNKSWAKQIKIDEWVYQPGVPQNCPRPNRNKFNAIDIIHNNLYTKGLSAIGNTTKWSSHEYLYFLRGLEANKIKPMMQQLDVTLDFTNTKNKEIAFEWYKLGIINNYEPIVQPVQDFLKSVGRKKFVVPLYKTMLSAVGTPFPEMAKEIFEQSKPNYHPETAAAVGNLFK
jgi:leukotriene-A4 hydrolase